MEKKVTRILIIDDSEFIHDSLEMLLIPEGYQLSFAINGKEGIEKANKLMPDLILLDVMMPSMDGFEVCERLRATSKLAEVPIIMLTALDDRDSRLRALEAGVDDFLTKPFDRVELRVRINSMTRLNRYRRLLTERSRFEWVIEQLNDGFLLLTDGNTIRYMNSAASFYLGINNSDNSKGFLQLIDKIYKREPTEAWKNWPIANNAESPRYLVRPETDDTPALWLQVEISEFITDNNHEQLLHLHDASEEMQLLRRMWSFQAMVSHKLRTPLNAFTLLSLIRSQKEFSSDTKELLDLLQTAIDSLQNRVLEVLQYVDTSSLIKVNDTFSLSKLRNLVMKLQEILELDMLKFMMDKRLQDKELLLSGQALELVLGELLKNAKKFHPDESPKIDILIELADTNTVVLSITDNGRHLPKEVLIKVWTAYYQYEKNFSGEVEGMGLGLPMVARLIWASGGDCQLYNREDQLGMRVELRLPLTTSK
jgi:CheY-like chemotaxis protein